MTSKTYADFGTMTGTASCELCGNVDPPAFKTFFELTPVGKNHKSITIKVNNKVMHWRFDWFQGKPAYVKFIDSERDLYVGIFDYEKNRVFPAPASLNADSEIFVLTNIMLQKFSKGELKYLFDILN